MNNQSQAFTKRKIDTQSYLDVMKELIKDGRTVSVTVAGNSMSPFLVHDRDRVFFEKPDRPLQKGDIVFFQRENGRYIMHRIWKVKDDVFYIVGDAQTEMEGPVRKEQIFARVTQCERKGKIIASGDFWWDFFEKVWIRMVPLRPFLVKGYEKIKNIFVK